MKKGFFIALLLLFVTCFASAQLTSAMPRGKIPKGKDEAEAINAYIQEAQQLYKVGLYANPMGTFSNNVPSKFSKTENQRIWDALDKYELEKDEFYDVTVILDNLNFCVILVKINEVYKDGSFSYSWWGIGTVLVQRF